jgi:hypothetical protein
LFRNLALAALAASNRVGRAGDLHQQCNPSTELPVYEQPKNTLRETRRPRELPSPVALFLGSSELA